MALLSLKVTSAVSIAGTTLPGTVQVKSANVTVPGQTSVTIGGGSGITLTTADGRYVRDTSTEPTSPVVGPVAPRNRALRDFVSVLDYGTWTSGDVTSQVLAASNDARDRGKKLWLPSVSGGGTYKITGAIVDTARTTPLIMEGDGGSSSILDASSVSSTLVMASLQGTIGSATTLTANASEGDVALVMTSVTGLSVGQWIHVQSTDSTVSSTSQKQGEIARIFAINAGTKTITVYDPLCAAYPSATAEVRSLTPIFGSRISGVRFLGPSDPTVSVTGLQLQYANDFVIDECDGIQTQNRMIDLMSCVNGTIRGGYVRDINYAGLAYGIAMSYACQDIEISGVVGHNMRHLVTHGGGNAAIGGWPRRITTQGCTISAAQDAGFDCHPCGEEINIFNNTIIGSNTMGSSGDGIVFQGATGQIRNNRISGVARDGILIQSATNGRNDVNVSGNTIRDAGQIGIAVSPVASYATGDWIRIVDNTILRIAPIVNAYAAIHLATCTNVLVDNNDITGHPTGIKVNDSGVTGTVGTHNRFSGVATPINNSFGGVVTETPPVASWDDDLRYSECESFSRHLATAAAGLTTGSWLGVRAVARTAQTFSQITFATSTNAPSSTYTDFRAGVTDTSGTLLQQTANAVATVTTGSTVYTLNLLGTVALTQGQQIQLGVAAIAGTLSAIMRCSAGLSTINSLTPKLAYGAAGALTTGNPITNPGTGGGSAALLWMALS